MTTTSSNAGTESIFISYSRRDWESHVRPLVDRLRQAGFSVWVDQHLLQGGQDWRDEINAALDQCGRMILCVSPDALESKYVRLEYRYFLDENKPIIPVICREAKLLPELRPLQWIGYDMDALIQLLGRPAINVNDSADRHHHPTAHSHDAPPQADHFGQCDDHAAGGQPARARQADQQPDVRAQQPVAGVGVFGWADPAVGHGNAP
ncbi:MAG: toll/interleukin-1 receptor domain-containing protein [Chloroflexi bacterium]|nr:toll/interleukin-1 receptor domain-containing protein [Chloroflexota bacterium]